MKRERETDEEKEGKKGTEKKGEGTDRQNINTTCKRGGGGGGRWGWGGREGERGG